MPSGSFGTGAVRPEPASELSVVRLVNLMLRHRGLVIGLPVALGALIVAVGLLGRRSYTSSASFAPQASDSKLGRLGGFAGQLGFALPTAQPSESPEFYVDLLRSRQVLGSAVQTTYRFATDTGTVSGTLVELFDAKGPTPERRRDVAIQRLRSRLTASADVTTGVVRLAVETPWPALSEQVTRQLLDLVNEFNLQSRQSQAASERRFVQGRLDEKRSELRRAENELQAFLQSNREYRASPQLTFRHERLAREVALRQQIVNSLTEAYEQAQIDEVRNTPVITVVEPPFVPVRPDPRRLALKAILGLMLGLVLAVVVAAISEFVRRERAEGSPDVEEFVDLRREAMEDLARPWRPIRRLFAGRR